MDKVQEKARIVSQQQVCRQTFRLLLASPRIAQKALPGQFTMLRVREGTDPLLRRPFSFSRIHAKEGQIEILYRVCGRGTWMLSQLGPGAFLSLVGPLGNGFGLPIDRRLPLALVAGGIGIAPLRELAVQIAAGRAGKNLENVHLFYGARTEAELLPAQTLPEAGIAVHFATDDGSRGYGGRVTALFEQYARENDFRPVEIYSCGPLVMQYHVARWAAANDALAQLSLESLMACGIGACLGCALPAADPANPASARFVHVCQDGPIFSAGSIQWNQIAAQQTPPPTYLFS